tara:strand:+ start:2439 stop:3728 length:1290 start_codon:yes stop_codon:yes gene_type:complete
MNSKDEILNGSAIAIKDGIILDIDAKEIIQKKYEAKIIITGEQRIIMPGLINGHSHAAMTLLRGIADDKSLIDWLNNYIFPLEKKFVSKEFVRVGTELACWEMIRGGTTTFVDMYFYPDIIAEVATRCGMRALVSSTVSDNQTPNAKNAEDALINGESFINRWKKKNSLITPILGPHAIYSMKLEQLEQTRNLANNLNTPISIHLSESQFESEFSTQNYEMTSIEALESINFFEGTTIAAHVVWPSDKEIEILAQRNVGVVHNPTSNMKLSSGVAPISKMIEAGVLVGLGTDGAASNNDLDMWEEMRLASLLQKVTSMDPEVLPAIEVLRMATSNGAKIIGMENEIGTIAEGMKADIIQIAYDDVHHIPSYDIASHLVYVTDEQDVMNVIIDGKLIMHQREFLTLDTEQIREEVTSISNTIKETMNSNQ